MLIEDKNIHVPTHIQALRPYVAGKTIEEVRQAFHPPRISKLASNENRLGCSPLVHEAVIRALESIHDYPDSAARQLRAALADKLGVTLSQIVVGAGSESVIGMLTRAFLQQGDEVVTADVTFLGFRIQAQIRGVRRVEVPVTRDFRFDLDAMAGAITPETRMIYIANPNNPTGTYVSREEFERFMSRVPEEVLVVMDEAYYEFAHRLPDFPDTVQMGYENVITLRTFSKAYGLAGMRVGYGIGPAELISNMLKVKFTFEPTACAQAAAVAALRDEAFLARTCRMVDDSRRRLYAFCDTHAIEYVISSSNSVLLVFADEEAAGWFTREMLHNGVILRQLTAFGMPNGVRVTMGTDAEMTHFEQTYLNMKHRAADS